MRMPMRLPRLTGETALAVEVWAVIARHPLRTKYESGRSFPAGAPPGGYRQSRWPDFTPRRGVVVADGCWGVKSKQGPASLSRKRLTSGGVFPVRRAAEPPEEAVDRAHHGHREGRFQLRDALPQGVPLPAKVLDHRQAVRRRRGEVVDHPLLLQEVGEERRRRLDVLIAVR